MAAGAAQACGLPHDAWTELSFGMPVHRMAGKPGDSGMTGSCQRGPVCVFSLDDGCPGCRVRCFMSRSGKKKKRSYLEAEMRVS